MHNTAFTLCMTFHAGHSVVCLAVLYSGTLGPFPVDSSVPPRVPPCATSSQSSELKSQNIGIYHYNRTHLTAFQKGCINFYINL